MKRKPFCLILIAALLFLAGCKKDAEINSALADVDLFTNNLVRLAKETPIPTDGVDAAQSYLDSNKSEIKAKARVLARVRGFQVSDDTERKLIETVRSDQMLVVQLQSYFMNRSMSDTVLKTKLDKLVNDYLGLFQA